MAYQHILYDVIDGNIAKITMNRPEMRNAQDDLMQWEMQQAFMDAELNEDIRVTIFAGAGKDFSGGHDMSGMRKEGGRRHEAPDDSIIGRAVANKMTGMEHQLMREDHLYLFSHLNIRNLSKPTIAMVQGRCLAGAWMTASMCDLIVAADDAKFGDPVVRMGPAGLELLFHPYDVGFRKAKWMLWTGDTISAQEALQVGLVCEVVPREKLEEATLALARRIAMNMPVAVSLVKRSINHAWELMGQRQAMEYHFLIHQLSHASDESARFSEGRRAAIEKGGVKEMLKLRDGKFKEGGTY